MDQAPTTRRLEEILQSIGSDDKLKDFLVSDETINPYGSFIEYFKSLPKTSHIVPADLYKRAGLDRSYCYKIWDGTKKPGRDKIILICLAAGLDNEETRRALESGGEAPLYSRNSRDAVIIYSISQGYNARQTSELLHEVGETILS